MGYIYHWIFDGVGVIFILLGGLGGGGGGGGGGWGSEVLRLGLRYNYIKI